MREKIEILIAQYRKDIVLLNTECNNEAEECNFNFAYHKSGQIKQLKRIVKDLESSIK